MKRKKYTLVLIMAICVLLNACSRTEQARLPTSDTDIIEATDIGLEQWKQWWDKNKVELPESNLLQFTNDKEGIYNYCPSIMKLNDEALYIYYCTNFNSYDVTDYIGCRKGVQNGDGRIAWGEEKIVLFPSAGTWDARHTCDPSVIAGDFKYQNKRYGYMMAYLGCTSSDNQNNKIGIAVSESPEGPFIKIENDPLVDFEMDSEYSGFQWGVGQPCLINADKQGRVWIFYTRGDRNGTRLVMDEWELTDLDAPQRLSTEEVSGKGLVKLNGSSDYMNNADLLYDAENKRFYASSDCHPNPSDEPNFISSHFRVTYFVQKDSFSDVVWKNHTVISPQMTNFARNHNTGLLRDEYGHMADNGYLTVFYTMSITGDNSLWSYRIYNYNLRIPT